MSQSPRVVFQDICESVISVVQEAGDFIEQHAGQVAQADIELKSMNSLVSFVDREAEEILVKGLKDIIPDSAFITEEDTVLNSEGVWQWIVDPLDGTTNYLHNIPFYSVSVALRYNSTTVLGVVYHISEEEMFYAWKNGGAYINGDPIKVSSKSTKNSLLATGFPYYDFKLLDEYMEVLMQLMQKTRGLRRCGSAALDLAYVAAGRFDIFFEYGLNPWDVAAGALIVKEAGGKVTNFASGEDYLFTREILAGNTTVHEDVQGLINDYLHEGSEVKEKK